MASARWIARPDDAGRTVEEIAARMGPAGRAAVAEGRAFVNGRRASGGELVAAGDLVECFDARAAAPRDGVDEVRILARAAGIVLAHKPATLASEPDRRGRDALTRRLAELLGVARVHAASRLDVGVSGVVACAVSEEGARRLARARGEGLWRRVYVAVLGGEIEGDGRWTSPVDGKPAETSFRVLARTGGATFAELELRTGRTHQIRVHAAAAGAPVLGDRAHGGRSRLTLGSGRTISVERPLLHAVAACVRAAPGGAPIVSAVDPPPDALRRIWSALDGTPAAWEEWRVPWERDP